MLTRLRVLEAGKFGLLWKYETEFLRVCLGVHWAMLGADRSREGPVRRNLKSQDVRSYRTTQNSPSPLANLLWSKEGFTPRQLQHTY